VASDPAPAPAARYRVIAEPVAYLAIEIDGADLGGKVRRQVVLRAVLDNSPAHGAGGIVDGRLGIGG
jgi:hypothetical protein